MRLAGSGATDPRWLEKIVKHPPSSLSTLEYWVGALDVDFAGGEGMGSLFRPAKGRGALRPEVRHLFAKFRYDHHHEDARRPRDMSLLAVDLTLDVAYVSVAQLLEAQLGAGRPFMTERGSLVEHGEWFYLRDAGDGSAHLSYEVMRPEWAIPPPPRGALENLLHALHDRLICDDDLRVMFTALQPLAAAAGAELHDWNMPRQIDLSFRPGIPLASVLAALRWENPVASSGSVHMSSWSVYPHRPELPWDAPHIKHWHVDVRLDGWPRGPDGAKLPEIGRAGPSPLYDVRDNVKPVIAISVRASSR